MGEKENGRKNRPTESQQMALQLSHLCRLPGAAWWHRWPRAVPFLSQRSSQGRCIIALKCQSPWLFHKTLHDGGGKKVDFYTDSSDEE